MEEKMKVNFDKVINQIKPMHGVGQPPVLGISTEMFHYLEEAHIPYSRLHDVGGWFGGNMFVDVPNVFRDFNADENDPASYDFAFTDIIINDLIKSGCEPVYRKHVLSFFVLRASSRPQALNAHRLLCLLSCYDTYIIL
jgi:hypothetical protein